MSAHDSTVEEIQARIDVKRSELATLEKELRSAERANAPVCKCGKLLWSDRGGYVQFVAVKDVNGGLHDFCNPCASEFIKQHGWANKGGTVSGAWDVPDPMGM